MENGKTESLFVIKDGQVKVVKFLNVNTIAPDHNMELALMENVFVKEDTQETIVKSVHALIHVVDKVIAKMVDAFV